MMENWHDYDTANYCRHWNDPNDCDECWQDSTDADEQEFWGNTQPDGGFNFGDHEAEASC